MKLVGAGHANNGRQDGATLRQVGEAVMMERDRLPRPPRKDDDQQVIEQSIAAGQREVEYRGLRVAKDSSSASDVCACAIEMMPPPIGSIACEVLPNAS